MARPQRQARQRMACDRPIRLSATRRRHTTQTDEQPLTAATWGRCDRDRATSEAWTRRPPVHAVKLHSHDALQSVQNRAQRQPRHCLDACLGTSAGRWPGDRPGLQEPSRTHRRRCRRATAWPSIVPAGCGLHDLLGLYSSTLPATATSPPGPALISTPESRTVPPLYRRQHKLQLEPLIRQSSTIRSVTSLAHLSVRPVAS